MSDRGMWLSEIIVTGYQNGFNQVWEDNFGTGSEFMAKKLSPLGVATATYVWNEDFEPDYAGGGVWSGDGYWKNFSTGDKITGKDASTDVWLEVGESLWFTAPEFYEGLEGDGYKFMTNGEVLQGAQTIPLCNDGTKMVGNPLPVDTWLSKTTVTGYHECTDEDAIQNWTDNYGTGSSFMIKILNGNGVATATYIWNEDFEPDYAGGGEWSGDGFWKNFSTGAKVTGEVSDTDVKVNAGSGLWFTSPSYWGSEGMYLNFPAALAL